MTRQNFMFELHSGECNGCGITGPLNKLSGAQLCELCTEDSGEF